MKKVHLYCPLIVLLFIGHVVALSAQELKPSSRPELNKLWEDLNVGNFHHLGLSIYDYTKKKWVFNFRDDNYFIPASNAKLVTMYSALQYLDENIAAGYYITSGDSMIIWGGGDPGTFYPDCDSTSAFVEFLKNTDKQLFFVDDHFTTTRYGKGWAWDDYSYDYQIERNAFPIYGNRLWIDRYHDSIVITPSYFQWITTIEKGKTDTLFRNEWGSQYTYHYDPSNPEDHQAISADFLQNDVKEIWKQTLGKDIQFIHRPFPKNALRIAGSNRDSLIHIMMLESDNHISEQLLLACALRQTGELNEKKFIEYLREGPLKGIPDKIQLVDGSGLSRYNLMTPRTCIWMLERIIEKKGIDYLKYMMPAGGVSGSLKDYYRGVNGQPYIFAKTGTLRNTHCLSGILITKSGKVLLFSWMNNQYMVPSRVIKANMEKIFVWLRDQY